MTSKFNEFYKSIIGESSDNPYTNNVTNEAAKKAKKSQKDKTIDKIVKAVEDPADIPANKEETVEDETGVKSLEKDFLNKFIRYNELQLLKNDLPEIANSFKMIQGFDERLIRDTVEKLTTDRQKELDTLTKELNELRDKITKEAEVANYKKSVIDIFNQETIGKAKENQTAYGYMERPNDPYAAGETLGNPEPEGNPETDQLMDKEELPADNNVPQEVTDLPQAVELNADVVDTPKTKAIKKSAEPAVLIDSKKSNKKKSTSKKK